MSAGSTSGTLVKHTGGCHCGAVRYELSAPTSIQVIDCNCTICTKKQNRHFIIPSECFKLLRGHDSLTTYTFNTHKAKHNFCKICGVQSFYIPRSNSDGIGVMPHCLDQGTVQKVVLETFDGRNWESAMNKNPKIKQRSKETKKSVDVMY